MLSSQTGQCRKAGALSSIFLKLARNGPDPSRAKTSTRRLLHRRRSRPEGQYLARSVGNCSGCHSPLNQLTFSLNGPEYSGGVALEPQAFSGVDPTVWFEPPNLTSLKGSALDRFPDRETFVARFQRGGRKHQYSPMPWELMGRMTSADAGALSEFLHSLPAAGKPSPQEPTVKHVD